MILSVFDGSLSYISTQVLLLKLKLTDLASFAGQFVLGISDPYFSEPWDRSTWHFVWVLSVQVQFFIHAQETVYSLPMEPLL